MDPDHVPVAGRRRRAARRRRNAPWQGIGFIASGIAAIFYAAGKPGITPTALLWGLAIFGILAAIVMGLNVWIGRGDETEDDD